MTTLFDLIEQANCNYFCGVAIEALAAVARASGAEKLALLERAEQHIRRQLATLRDGEEPAMPAPVEPAKLEPAPVEEVAPVVKRNPKSKIDAVAAAVQKYIDTFPTATWDEVFANVKNPYKNAASLRQTVKSRVQKPDGRKFNNPENHPWKGQKKSTATPRKPAAMPRPHHRKTLAEAQTEYELREKAAAAADELEFVDDDAREEWIEEYVRENAAA